MRFGPFLEKHCSNGLEEANAILQTTYPLTFGEGQPQTYSCKEFNSANKLNELGRGTQASGENIAQLTHRFQSWETLSRGPS